MRKQPRDGSGPAEGAEAGVTAHSASSATPEGNGMSESVRLARTAGRPDFASLPDLAARQLGGSVYALSSDPFKFQDAVLVGTREDYYGECSFQIDTSTPGYVKLDRSVLRGLFGKFNPSRGDVVLSHTGEFLGIMVNSTYCLMLHDFAAAATLPFGTNVRAEHTGGVLARLYDNVFQMPQRLQ